MNLEASLTRFKNYILIEISGRYDRGEMEKLIADLYKQIAETKCDSVLVDITKLPGSIPNLDRFYLGSHYAREVGPRVKLALVNRQEEINRLFEDTAVNRSGDVCVFANRKKALAWLGVKP